jgi:hypothetical protein
MKSHKSNHSIRNLYTHAYSYCQPCFQQSALLRSIFEDVRAIDIRKQNSLESTRDLILMAGQTAHPLGEFQLINESAIQKERDLFCEYIKSLTREYLDLPRLDDYYHICIQESNEITHKIREKWGDWYGGSCQEISSSQSTQCITFEVGIFIDDREHEEFPTKKTYQDLINILTSNKINRVYEIGEDERDYELDINDAIDNFEGSERFWTNTELNFLIYSSHESTITFGGMWLIDEIKQICPYWQDYFY